MNAKISFCDKIIQVFKKKLRRKNKEGGFPQLQDRIFDKIVCFVINAVLHNR